MDISKLPFLLHLFFRAVCYLQEFAKIEISILQYEINTLNYLVQMERISFFIEDLRLGISIFISKVSPKISGRIPKPQISDLICRSNVFSDELTIVNKFQEQSQTIRGIRAT